MPGHLEEKITALIRTLPKSIRTGLVPAPDTARKAAAALAFGEGPFLPTLARVLEQIVRRADSGGGVSARSAAGAPGDEDPPGGRAGQDVGGGCEPGSPARSVRGAAVRHARPAGRRGLESPGHARLGFRQSAERDHDHARRPARARLSGRARSRRRRRRALARHGRSSAPGIPGRRAPTVLSWPSASRCKRTWRGCPACATSNSSPALLPGRAAPGEPARSAAWPIVRSSATASCRARKPSTSSGWPTRPSGPDWPSKTSRRSSIRCSRPFTAPGSRWRHCRSSRWPQVAQDVRRQLDALVHGRVPHDNALGVAATLPALLPRDCVSAWTSCSTAASSATSRHWSRLNPGSPLYEQRAAAHRQRGAVDPQLVLLRWMMEEFRVSLFAQQLGTSLPVSAQRLEKQWRWWPPNACEVLL